VLSPEICILTVTVTQQFGYTFCRALYIKYVNWGYQNNDQYVSLIPKWDPRITNFSIPDLGIENPIPGLQSLVYTQYQLQTGGLLLSKDPEKTKK